MVDKKQYEAIARRIGRVFYICHHSDYISNSIVVQGKSKWYLTPFGKESGRVSIAIYRE